MARSEFDFTVQEVAQGRPLAGIAGLSYRVASSGDEARIRHNPERAVLEDMDRLPFVTPVYRRDLTVENYAIGYLRHPYVSLYTGRGCRSKCTFCLWPQTVGGQRYRTRSVEHVAEEMALAQRLFPRGEGVLLRRRHLHRRLAPRGGHRQAAGPLGITWSVNAKANVPADTLKVLRDNGLRLLLVGYESGDQRILNNVKKGVRLDAARRFTRDAKDLGITIHGTFILGLPGETRETIAETIRFAREIDPHTIQVSLAAPYPGTALYAEAQRNGWLESETLVDGEGVQQSAIGYPHLPRAEIFQSVDLFYRRFYFRPRKMISLAGRWCGTARSCAAVSREGRDFSASSGSTGGPGPGRPHEGAGGMKVLVIDTIAPEGLAYLRERGFQVDEVSSKLPRSAPRAPGRLRGHRHAVLHHRHPGVPRRARRLRILGRAGVGVDNIDIDACSRQGVVVVNAPTATWYRRPSTPWACCWRWCARSPPPTTRSSAFTGTAASTGRSSTGRQRGDRPGQGGLARGGPAPRLRDGGARLRSLHPGEPGSRPRRAPHRPADLAHPLRRGHRARAAVRRDGEPPRARASSRCSSRGAAGELRARGHRQRGAISSPRWSRAGWRGRRWTCGRKSRPFPISSSDSSATRGWW